MPLDPYIARGLQAPDVSQSMAQIGALRQRDQALTDDRNYQNALLQQAQQKQAAEQQDAQRKQQALQVDAFMSAAQEDPRIMAQSLDAAEKAGKLPAHLANWRQMDPAVLQADIKSKQREFRAQNADLFPQQQPEYGQPVAGIDPATGQPVFNRFAKNAVGGVTVPGFAPTPKDVNPAGGSNVTVKMAPQESAENKKVGEELGQMYIDTQKAGANAYGKIARLDRLSNLLQGVETGKLTPTTTSIAAYAQSFGIKVDPNLPAKQAINSITGEMALQMRNPSGGAGMPGAMSDKDREFLMSIVPGLANTPGGNALIIDTYKRLAQRDVQVAKMAREYRIKHGQLDDGFYSELQQFADANPLFPASQAGPARPGQGANRVIDFSSIKD